MKKVIAIITTFILSVSVIMAQSTPDGINYQAVARNLKGEILAKQPVSLKVSLFKVNNNQRVEYYREIQQVTTSTVGVFSVALGKGQAEFGQFVDVPWSTENIWMEISIKSKGDADFTSISSNKLLAVPYAFHSITAERLANGSGNISNATSTTTTTNGTPSNSWLVFSNRSSNPATDRLGTGDYTDLNIATNYEPRIIVKADGRTQFVKSATFQDTVFAEKSVRLNTVSGNTINYGNFTVDRKSSTALTGTLKVDSSTQLQQTLRVGGVTDLMSNLNVNNLSPTFLSGTLKVDGVTDLNNNLNVNNKKSTVLTGTLTVDSPSIFKSYVKLTNSALDQDTAGGGANALPSGALQVAGGGYFGGNVVIKKNLKIGGELASGVLIATSDSESVSTTTGALRVRGGAGITRNVNIGGAVKIDSTLIVQKDVKLNSTTQSLDSANGALVVKGGVGIEKNLNVGGEMNVTTDAPFVANFKNKSGRNGISITINSSETADKKVNNDNNFVEFRNGANQIVGRIEGETIDNLDNNFDYGIQKRSYIADVVFGGIDVANDVFELATSGTKLVSDITGITGCFGFGACVTVPITSKVVQSGYEIAARVIVLLASITSTAFTAANLGQYIDDKNTNIGVTYQSGAGDYAEYLKKQNIIEDFLPGDIVGIKGGLISKNVDGAEKVLVISKKPIVLGNVPQSGDENNYEKVAFLGQVPVRVVGKVNVGDYILPNGLSNGVGKAVAPSEIKSSDIKNIVGIAWSSSSQEIGISFINVAVGLNVNDNQKAIESLENEVKDLKKQLAETNSKLDKFLSSLNMSNNVSSSSLAAITQFNSQQLENVIHPKTDNSNNNISSNPYVQIPSVVDGYRPKEEDIIKMVDQAKEELLKTKNEAIINIINKMDNDPSYREEVLKVIRKEVNNAFDKAKIAQAEAASKK